MGENDEVLYKILNYSVEIFNGNDFYCAYSSSSFRLLVKYFMANSGFYRYNSFITFTNEGRKANEREYLMRKSIISAAVFLTLSACVPLAAHDSLAAAKQNPEATAVASAIESSSAAAQGNSAQNVSMSRGSSMLQTQKTANPAPKYGELIRWSKVDNLIPRETTFQVRDLDTGKTFSVTRTYGTNHIDCEATTLSDTYVIKSIWGGFSWERRAVIVTIDGRSIAASMTAMPHAGLDSKPANETVSNRSDGYGRGTNLDEIKNNGMNGVMDIHFLGSTRHLDGHTDYRHQEEIQRAAGN